MPVKKKAPTKIHPHSVRDLYHKEFQENIQEVFWLTDVKKSKMLYISPGYERIWGRSCKSLYDRPRSWLDAIFPSERKRVLKAATTLQTKGRYDVTYRILRPDGKVRWIRDIAVPIRDRSGKVRRIAGLATDITKMKETEQALENSRNQLRQILDASTDMILVKGPGSRILWGNKAFCDYYGMSVHQLSGIIDAPFNKPDYTAQYLKDDAYVFDTGEPLIIAEEPVTRHDGEVRMFHTVKSPVFDANGKVSMLVAVCRDITAAKKLERQVFLSEKLTAVGQLAGGIAHEVNNALTGIIGLTHLLEASLPKNHAGQQDIRDLLATADRTSQMVHQLLAFSRRSPSHKEPLDLNAVVGRMRKMLAPAIGERAVVELRLDGNLPSISADATQIEQVVINLCLNARDALRGEGKITIETSKVLLQSPRDCSHGLLSPGLWARLLVRDSGSGLSPEIREHIFEPFFSTKKAGEGTGLGLSVVYGILKEHGAVIDLVDVPSGGLEFNIYWPTIQDAPKEELRPVHARENLKGSGTILMAEDDAMARQVLARILEKNGYRVLSAIDGQEALDIFEAHKDEVDLLLLDVIMPKLQGDEVYRRISSRHPSVKALLMSGYITLHALNNLCSQRLQVLAKPYQPHQLLSQVKSLMASRG